MAKSRFGQGSVLYFSLLGLLIAGVLNSCAKKEVPKESHSCAPENLSEIAGKSGHGLVFFPDPMVSAKNFSLSPKNDDLDRYRLSVPFSRLTGKGVLEGQYVSVVNDLQCQGNFGAYEPKNDFSYSHSDSRFQEAMAYYVGDLYRAAVDEIGYLGLKNSIPIKVHCYFSDDAFYQRGVGRDGQIFEKVCLGDSTTSPGASYADDAMVTIHELTHGVTANNYSMTDSMGAYRYDEAGALNEAISDFVSLIFTDGIVNESDFDNRFFSRWALGSFDSSRSSMRGAHRCPMYDSLFPECGNFPKFAAISDSSSVSSISYVYPDGLGWPFPNNTTESNPLVQLFKGFPLQEEIHNAVEIILGTLWDSYSVIRKNHTSGVGARPDRLVLQWVMESVKHLPPPDNTKRSPVNFVLFSETLLTYMNAISDFTPEDKQAVREVFKARGLYEFSELSSDWAAAGKGTNFKITTTSTPGVRIEDHPEVLKSWLYRMNSDPSLVTQGLAGANYRLNPGEVVAIWFDVQNNSLMTAGSVEVTVASPDPDIAFLDYFDLTSEMPYITPKKEVQVIYGKINGTSIVSSLSPAAGSQAMPVGNSYFTTNAFFNRTYSTAVWLRVHPKAVSGKIVQLMVKAEPSNGAASVVEFPITIY